MSMVRLSCHPTSDLTLSSRTFPRLNARNRTPTPHGPRRRSTTNPYGTTSDVPTFSGSDRSDSRGLMISWNMAGSSTREMFGNKRRGRDSRAQYKQNPIDRVSRLPIEIQRLSIRSKRCRVEPARLIWLISDGKFKVSSLSSAIVFQIFSLLPLPLLTGTTSSRIRLCAPISTDISVLEDIYKYIRMYPHIYK